MSTGHWENSEFYIEIGTVMIDRHGRTYTSWRPMDTQWETKKHATKVMRSIAANDIHHEYRVIEDYEGTKVHDTIKRRCEHAENQEEA